MTERGGNVWRGRGNNKKAGMIEKELPTCIFCFSGPFSPYQVKGPESFYPENSVMPFQPVTFFFKVSAMSVFSHA